MRASQRNAWFIEVQMNGLVRETLANKIVEVLLCKQGLLVGEAITPLSSQTSTGTVG